VQVRDEPQEYEPPDPPDYEPPDYEPPDPSDYEPDLYDEEPPDYDPSDNYPDPSDDEPDPADYEPDPSDYEPDYDDGWSDEIDFEQYQQQIYDDAVRQFTEERLRSYFVANPNLAEPALDALKYAQSLLRAHPMAALIFAATAMELAIKVVILKPIVAGLVHTEGLAEFITDLTTQHTGMDRFRDLLAEIFARFGGVDLKTYKRPNSTMTFWQEIAEVQSARNGVIHRGEKARKGASSLAVAVAATLLKRIFPSVLEHLNLHLHDPGVICNQKHTTILSVTFTASDPPTKTALATVELNIPGLDWENPPDAISGEVTVKLDEAAFTAMRSALSDAYMQFIGVRLRYRVEFDPDSTKFIWTKVDWS
jgi:hypothetical protein